MRNILFIIATFFTLVFTSCTNDYIEPELETTQNTFVYSHNHILYFLSEFTNETSEGFETVIICNGKGHDYYNCSVCCKPIKITISKEAALKIDNSIQAVDSLKNCGQWLTKYDFLSISDKIDEDWPSTMYWYLPNIDDNFNSLTLIGSIWEYYVIGLCIEFNTEYTEYIQNDGHFHSYEGNDDIYGHYNSIRLTDAFLNSLHNYCNKDI